VVRIKWERCLTYAAAARAKGVIYLHEWNGSPFYWGMADKFGTRYAVGYSHWIEGILQHGGRLYVGTPEEHGDTSLEGIEYALIKKYGSLQNKKRLDSDIDSENIEHIGNVPESILSPGIR